MKKTKLNSCNVLEEAPDSRRLWRFEAKGDALALASQLGGPRPVVLPPNLVRKDWLTLWQAKVNVAWLPAEQVFLKVLQLPVADHAELVSMIEFQLEKLSPLPVTQIVWSIEVLPGILDNQQTIVVVVAPRQLVESFLGQLEGDGYYTDRLEVPLLHQLLVTGLEQDGVWIFPSRIQGKLLALVAWKFAGTLRQIQLLQLPDNAESPKILAGQMLKMAWAGEAEGWMPGNPKWNLVAVPEDAALWQNGLQTALAEPVSVFEPAPADKLATLSARRAESPSGHVNLMPAEQQARYRQQFIDRLWMNGISAVLAAYMACVLVYFAALQVVRFQHGSVEHKVTQLKTDYTNAVKLKEQISVLQNQLDLKFAALDSLRAAAELLPAELTLDQLILQSGQRLQLQGKSSSDKEITDYSDKLRKIKYGDQAVFSKVDLPKWDLRPGNQYSWRFECTLNRTGL